MSTRCFNVGITHILESHRYRYYWAKCVECMTIRETTFCLECDAFQDNCQCGTNSNKLIRCQIVEVK